MRTFNQSNSDIFFYISELLVFHNALWMRPCIESSLCFAEEGYIVSSKNKYISKSRPIDTKRVSLREVNAPFSSIAHILFDLCAWLAGGSRETGCGRSLCVSYRVF